MRHAEFMRSGMSMIRDELGLTQRYLSHNKSVAILSELFARVMQLAHQHYGIEESTSHKLQDDLRKVLMPADRPMSEELDSASQLAYQNFVKCPKNPGRFRTRKVMFKRNRYEHAMDILAAPMPSEGFTYIESKKLPPKGARLKWLSEQDSPLLVEAAVLNVSAKFANVIAFGSGSNNARRWISHPELLALQPFATFEINSVFMFDQYESLKVRMPPPFVDGIGVLSTAIGLLAENYWIAIASPQAVRGSSRKLHCPRNAWMRATDRLFSMMPAMEVHAHGIQVDSYGVGSVTIDVPFSNMQEVIEIAGVAGLFPPHYAPDDGNIQGDLA